MVARHAAVTSTSNAITGDAAGHGAQALRLDPAPLPSLPNESQLQNPPAGAESFQLGDAGSQLQAFQDGMAISRFS